MDEPAETTAPAFRRALERLQARPVVSLLRYREVRLDLERAEACDLIRALQAEVLAIAKDEHARCQQQLVDWIGKQAKSLGVPGRRSVAWLAAWVADRSYFWRTSRKARRWYAQFAEVPSAEVPACTRGGRKVREHLRLLGNNHLAELTSGVGVSNEVIQLIISGAHRLERASRSTSPGCAPIGGTRPSRGRRARARRAGTRAARS
jgi:hypothetical protein